MAFPSFWSRLRSARIVRVVVIYLGASWVVLQVTNELQQAVNLPQWVSGAAVVLLLIGLIITLATAWVQAQPATVERAANDEVPGGWEVGLGELRHAVTRGELPHLTWARSLLGGVLAFCLLFGVAGVYIVIKNRGEGLGPAPAEAAVAPGIAVVPFSVSGQGLDVWREGMVDLLSTSLDGAGGLRTIDARTVLARWKERVKGDAPADLPTALAVARSTGARYAIVGNAVAPGPQVRLSADVYDLQTDADLGPKQVEGEATGILALADQLSVKLLQSILSNAGAGDVHRLADVTTSSPVALKAFLEGEAAFRRSDFAGTIAADERAVAADSTFAFALYRLSQAYGWSESINSAKGGEYLEQAMRHSDRLTPRQAVLVRGAYELENGRLDELDALREATRHYPDDAELWYQLGDTYHHLGGQALVGPDDEAAIFQHAVALDPSFAPYRLHLVDVALASGDSARAARTVAAYDSVAAGTLEARSYHLALRLAYGDSASRTAARAALDTASDPVIQHVGNAFTVWQTQVLEPGLEIARLRRARPTATVFSAYGLTMQLVFMGRYRQAVEQLSDPLLPAPLRRAFAYRLYMAGTSLAPAVARDLVVSTDTTRATDLGNLVAGAYAADHGAWPEHAAAIAQERERAKQLAAAGDSLRSRFDDDLAIMLEAYGEWRRSGKPDDVLQKFAAVQPRLTGLYDGWVVNEILRGWMADLYVETNQPEQAIRYLRSLEMEGLAHYRIARIRMQLNQPDSARAELAEALHFWKDADPDLPQLAEAHRMLQQLGADRPR
jgi:tetratricopeptide (TPR) repeat protein